MTPTSSLASRRRIKIQFAKTRRCADLQLVCHMEIQGSLVANELGILFNLHGASHLARARAGRLTFLETPSEPALKAHNVGQCCARAQLTRAQFIRLLVSRSTRGCLGQFERKGAPPIGGSSLFLYLGAAAAARRVRRGDIRTQ